MLVFARCSRVAVVLVVVDQVATLTEGGQVLWPVVAWPVV